MMASTAISPPALRPGDTVAVCAPAGPVPGDRLGAGLAVLEGRYRVRTRDDVLARAGYLAGDDERRIDELNGYLRDPDVRAIIAARGGYGLMRILDRLDADALRRDPKLIVGFSDVTALLAWAQAVAGVRCIHGPMVAQLGELPSADVVWLFALMEKVTPPGRAALSLEPIGMSTGVPVEGRLAGGNLCLLAHLFGTPYSVDLDGAVLMIEDVGERPYRLDRYLTQLGLAGALERCAGALVGELIDCVESKHSDHPDALAVVDERLRRYGVPGLRGAPMAHGQRNLALPLGGRCVLDPGQRELILLEAAVA